MLLQSLLRIYGEEKAKIVYDKLSTIMEKYKDLGGKTNFSFDEKDVFLITYGDSLKKNGEKPLKTFKTFADLFFKQSFSTVHFLPIYPWSSDDGFSVRDFFSVDPALGNWEDVNATAEHFSLMLDYVLNHISSESDWFARFLNNEEGYENLAITFSPEADLSMVIRPRTHPLLTPFKKQNGDIVHVWTTFSDDQIDLNWESPDVVAKMTDVLLFYVKNGADVLRMDAVAYLWKKEGASCIHLPETHEMVKLFRKILDKTAPHVMIITETNVPHEENISYFGNGGDEAQVVYNFTLPPLLLHTFLKEDATLLSRWAKTLTTPSEKTTFFNFTASHDGIGVRPLEGILPDSEIKDLADYVRRRNGRVSLKKNTDGSESPYELNITYVDAMGKSDDDPLHVQRFLASQAIQFALPGIPAVYILSLLGGRNWYEGLEQTGRARTINREKLDVDALKSDLNDPESFRSRIFYPYNQMIQVRRAHKAFHPNAPFEILDPGNNIFAMKRGEGKDAVYTVTNVSDQKICLDFSSLTGLTFPAKDLISGAVITSGDVTLDACRYAWLMGS